MRPRTPIRSWLDRGSLRRAWPPAPPLTGLSARSKHLTGLSARFFLPEHAGFRSSAWCPTRSEDSDGDRSNQ